MYFGIIGIIVLVEYETIGNAFVESFGQLEMRIVGVETSLCGSPIDEGAQGGHDISLFVAHFFRQSDDSLVAFDRGRYSDAQTGVA